jgi:hypothetical protein
LKLGILVVGSAPALRKGLSKEVMGASALLRLWTLVAEEATARVVVGREWRAQRRGREAVDEERGGILGIREVRDGVVLVN